MGSNVEDVFAEIVGELLDYHAECQENENCGIGNDEINLYKARDLARKHDLKKVLKVLCYDLNDDDKTAEQYKEERQRKFQELARHGKLKR